MDKIIAKDIVKTLKGKTVLNHVDLELEKGLVHGFFGRNRIGKDDAASRRFGADRAGRGLCGGIRQEPDKGACVS